jgi:threonine dehydratase
MARSLEAGRRVVVEPAPTLADGLKPVEVGAIPFAIARQWLAGCRRVTDDEIGRAVSTLHHFTGVVVEPSGAAALAAAFQREPLDGARRVGVILSGGNVAPEAHASLCRRYPPWS